MMRHRILFLAALLAVISCDRHRQNPYPSILTLEVVAAYPDGVLPESGVRVSAGNLNTGDSYIVNTDGSGTALFNLPSGVYDISLTDVRDQLIYSGVRSRFPLRESQSLPLTLSESRAGSIVIKEIYCGGCRKTPMEGTYQYDKYVILHNNYIETLYLDGLCFGSLYPFNSIANNHPWKPEEVEFVPVGQCVWQFGGNGTSFPLAPGEDAVICLNGAIDHAAQYPLSVNLNKEEYFVCYNSTYFTNTNYHPAPGDRIRQERYLEVVVKTGSANAYTFSINSPAVVIFRAEGMSIQDYVSSEGAVIQTPGDTHNPVVAIPVSWVIDAVEVFSGSSASNMKRLPAGLDAGSVSLSSTYEAHTLMRFKDEDLSKARGYEVLMDTNNSSMDLYETETQSLHEK